VWWFLLPFAWGPWIAFYLWARAIRAPWWRWWLLVPFAGWIFWIFAWVIWLTPAWGWVIPAAVVPILFWWWWWKGKAGWDTWGPKLCFILSWAWFPFFFFANLLWDPWWCWVFIAFFVLTELCILFHFVWRQSWWTWWLWWLILIFLWIPIFLVGLVVFCPWWWWIPLLGWFPAIWGVAWFWARKQTWWKPWWWLWPVVWTGGLVFGLFVWQCQWWWLLPFAWGPWVLFYLWARAFRAPWWRWWLAIPFGAWIFWIFAWAVWLAPGWWWIAAVVPWPVMFWWWWWKKEWTVAGPKFCFLKGWALLPPLAFAVALYCPITPGATTPRTQERPAATVETPQQFLAPFSAAFRRGDTAYLLSRLHPAVLQRYTEQQCLALITSVRFPDADFQVLATSGPAPYQWTTDDQTTTIPDALTVTVRRNPSAAQQDIHLAPAGNGLLGWFTDCT
jgi:hypothetical protein